MGQKRLRDSNIEDGQAATPSTSVGDAGAAAAASESYLLTVAQVETTHSIDAAGTEALTKGPNDKCPGLNCCAVCCVVVDDPTPCDGCNKVLYCSSEHQIADQPVHEKSCALLYCISQAEQCVTAEQVLEAVSLFEVGDCQVLDNHEGWPDIAPKAFHHLFEGVRRNKRQKQSFDAEASQSADTAAAPAHVGNGSVNADAVATVSQPADAAPKVTTTKAKATAKTAAGPAIEPSKPAAAGSHFTDGVLFALSSEVLSYPYTVLHSLLTVDSLKSVMAAKEQTPAKPLVLCVLGAACGAELNKLVLWKVLEGLVPGGVILFMIGPDVPEALHQQVQPVSPNLTICFWKGEYDAAATLAAAAMTAGSAAEEPSPWAHFPDAFFSFNAGLTSPDYEWLPTIESMQREVKARATANTDAVHPVRLPWLVASSTQVEAQMESELLLSNGWRSVGGGVHDNPWKSLHLVQSSTLANEVYRKNAWVACYELLQTPQRPALHRRLSSWIKTAYLNSPLSKISRRVSAS